MEVVIEKKLFENFLRMMLVLGEEANFSINSEGITGVIIDPGRAAMFTGRIVKSALNRVPEKGADFGMNISKMMQMLKGMDGDIHLDFDSRLQVSDGFLTATLGAIEVSMPKPVNFDKFTASILIPTSYLSSIAMAGASISEELSITVNESGVSFAVPGTEESAVLFLPKGLAGLEIKGSVNSAAYSLEYIRNIVKGINSSQVVLDLARNYPVKIHVENSGIVGDYYVAPRIE